MTDNDYEQYQKADRLARDILNLSRSTLMVHLRFLDAALNLLKFCPGDGRILSTDGNQLFYNFYDILLTYKNEKECVTRNYLHAVLHCVFRHMFIHTKMDRPRWDLACDIAVENIINDLQIRAVEAGRSSSQAPIIAGLKQEIKYLTAERIYRYLLDLDISDSRIEEMNKAFRADDHTAWYLLRDEADDGTEEGYNSDGGISDGGGDASQQRDASRGDDSENKGKPKDDPAAGEGGGSEHSSDKDSGNAADSGGDQQEEGTNHGGAGADESGTGENHEDEPDRETEGSGNKGEDHQGSGNRGENGDGESPDENSSSDQSESDKENGNNESDQEQQDAQHQRQTPKHTDKKAAPSHHDDDHAKGEAAASEQMWQDISERMKEDMENFSKMQGSRAGSFLQNLKEVNREKVDYSAFLQKFAVRTEIMKIDDDEFDYIFYTYGLQNYENRMPLVEPLEYREAKRVREFVIIIDTSGSVSGETVQGFIRKTYNVLQSTESFTSRINLHIIQCDAAVQSDQKISSRDELEAYIRQVQIQGLGGTDFRPAFEYVNELVQKKEFMNLRGLIYFTDGYGAFPVHKPEYETAFVFLDEDDNNYETPAWAIRLVLRKDEI